MGDAPSTRSPRELGGWLSSGLAVSGGFAAFAIVGHELGAGAFATVLLLAAVITAARPRPWTTESAIAAFLALALLSMVIVIDAGWVLAFDVIFGCGLASYSVVGGRTFSDVGRACVRFVGRLPDAFGLAFSPAAHTLAPLVRGRARPHARGLLLGGILIVVFGGLLISADAAYREIALSAFTPDVDGWMLPARAGVLFFVMLLGASLIAAGTRYAGPPAPSSRANDILGSLRRSDWAIPLVALDLLFGSFVALQVAVLFGGRHHVLETAGLSFAEYARQGFFQLVFVAAATLAVVAAAVTWSRTKTRRDRMALRLLLGLLCLLTLAILASALKRLNLYVDVYGATRLRVSVHATILWLGGIFILVIAAGATWRGRWLPRAALFFTGMGLIAFTLSNPEAAIARQNVELFRETGDLDALYVTTLGPDAVPQLARLPEPVRSCLLEDEMAALGNDAAWPAFNFSRDRAKEVLESVGLQPCTGLWPPIP